MCDPREPEQRELATATMAAIMIWIITLLSLSATAPG